ncbi:MAG: DUF192 domain-containing protein [Elusimicrobia bacterium]|nr:DUF192 domain-containing protein [Elusimicrobiota bacterium]
MRILLTLALAAQAGSPLKARKQTTLDFPDGKRIVADVVDTPVERERGLMFRKKLPKDYGMLFVFSRELPMTFWMKNTLVSLDIVFIGADKKVTKVHERVKASTEKTPDEDVARVGGPAQFVLELPAGAAARHRLKEGEPLAFKAEPPER